MDRFVSCCLSGYSTNVYIPPCLSKEDADMFVAYEKNRILEDCIINPRRYLND